MTFFFLFAIFSTLISYIVVSLEIFSSQSANRITEVLLENLARLFRVYGLKVADALRLGVKTWWYFVFPISVNWVFFNREIKQCDEKAKDLKKAEWFPCWNHNNKRINKLIINWQLVFASCFSVNGGFLICWFIDDTHNFINDFIF